MPQVKIHVSSEVNDLEKGRLVIEMRECIGKYRKVNDGTLQVIVYDSQYRIGNYHRADNFILIEMLICTKITTDEKQELANILIDKAEEITKIPSDDITVIYHDTQNIRYWGKVNQNFLLDENQQEGKYEKDNEDKKDEFKNEDAQDKHDKEINEENNYEIDSSKIVEKKYDLEPTSKDKEETIDNSKFELLYCYGSEVVDVTGTKILKF